MWRSWHLNVQGLGRDDDGAGVGIPPAHPDIIGPGSKRSELSFVQHLSPAGSVADVVQRHPLFVAFRKAQAEIQDRSRPCPLIDHPEAFRRICASVGSDRGTRWTRFTTNASLCIPSVCSRSAQG